MISDWSIIWYCPPAANTPLSPSLQVTSGSGKPAAEHVSVSLVPVSVLTLAPISSSRGALSYHSTNASEELIDGVTGSEKYQIDYKCLVHEEGTTLTAGWLENP